jgi:hypothetical protein
VFGRYHDGNSGEDWNSQPSVIKRSTGSHRKTHHGSPITSETETDDPGILFVPKKYLDRAGTNRGSFSSHTEQGDSHSAVGRTNGSPPESSSNADSSSTLWEIPSSAPAHEGPLGGKEALKEAGTGRQGGQTITETELMRRRRLLDSHLIE